MNVRRQKWFAGVVGIAVIALVNPSDGQEEGELDKANNRILQGFDKLASRVHEKIKREIDTIGFVAATTTDDASVEKVGGRLNSLLLQASLAHSLLVAPLDSDDDLDVVSEDGEFSRQALLRPENVKHMQKERGLRYLLISHVRSKGDVVILSLELLDLQKTRRLLAQHLPVGKTSDLANLDPPDILPELNVAVLTFAVANLGNQVDAGECWDLPANPLRREGFTVKGYDFGKETPWQEALPGDVITIDNGTFRHVMVLLEPTELKKNATVLHQNVGGKRFVVKTEMFPKYPPEDLVIWRPGAEE